MIFINFVFFPILSRELAESVPIKVDQYTYDSPHTKTHLLLQAHFSRLPLPIADYGTDTKSALDQAIRIMQAMIYVCADEGWLSTVHSNCINCFCLAVNQEKSRICLVILIKTVSY